MAHTAFKKEEEKKEYFDSEEELDLKISTLAEWIRESEHFIVFTGAGISTSAGIPDFRSGYNTKLKVGPGAWEVKAQKKAVPKEQKKAQKGFLQALPTNTHMSFVKLMELGLLKYVISQNTDGLHRRSGIHPARLAELHGNTNLEICKKCGRDYMRDFRTRTSNNVHKHETGRFCDDPNCRGELMDSIINFGENLIEGVLQNATENAFKADLCVALGSSLTVTPAADLPLEVAERGKRLVIVNLQKTPLDDVAAMRINGMCDKVMTLLMKKLNIEIPPFKLQRRLMVSKSINNKGKAEILFKGVDVDLNAFTIFPKIQIFKGTPEEKLFKQEPFLHVCDVIPPICETKLFFQGHYQEPSLELMIDMDGFENSRTYLLEYNPQSGNWDNIGVLNEN